MKRIPRPTVRRLTAALRRVRPEADDRIGSRCDIVGSMVGVKIRGGSTLPRLCLTYLVREKVPVSELSPKKRIPSRISVAERSIATDVMVWPAMATHGLQTGLFIRDGYTQGTLTAFAESAYGLWGMSCGHCMLGADKDASTAAEIEMFDSTAGDFIAAGSTGMTLFAPGGREICGSRGYLDCGLFGLDDSSLLARAQSASALATVDAGTLLHQHLTGNSVIALAGFAASTRTAEVVGIDQYGVDDYSDLVLMVDGPGMVHGDSGMLWLTSDGRAAAIHSRGEERNDGQASRLITAMSARRATEVLNVTLRRA